nr:MAG TPA: hypothetical protein [Caudoviricetes sp.]
MRYYSFADIIQHFLRPAFGGGLVFCHPLKAIIVENPLFVNS